MVLKRYKLHVDDNDKSNNYNDNDNHNKELDYLSPLNKVQLLQRWLAWVLPLTKNNLENKI